MQECPCGKGGMLLPFSDYGPDGSHVEYKVWACTGSPQRPDCEWAMRIDKGSVSHGRLLPLPPRPAGNSPHSGPFRGGRF